MKYIRSLICFTISFSILTFCEAQSKQGQARIDSLLAQLPKAADDTNKVNLLVDLSFTYVSTNPDEGISIGKVALTLAEKLNWEKGMADANMRIGNNCVTKSDYPRALEYFLNALTVYEKLGDKTGTAKDLSNIGIVYHYQADYPKALEYYFRALSIAEELGNKTSIALTIANIALTYTKQRDYPKAEEYYFKALKILEELGNKAGIAATLGNIGDVYTDQKDYSKALEYYFKALKMNEAFGNKFRIASALGTIGKVYLALGRDSNNIQLKQLFGGNKTTALQQAKGYTDSAIVIDKEIGDLKNLSIFYNQLSEIQTLQGDNKSALESFKMYSIFKDSVFNLEKDKKLTQISMQYEFDKKETFTKAEQEKKDIQQRLTLYSIMAGLVSMIVFSIIVYRQRNKVKIQKQIVEKEKSKSDDLLLNILPAEVAEELKATGTAKAKAFTMVTVMFTDFKDFTRVSEKVSAELLVDEIHDCFSAFDKIIEKHKIEKIKTIGDAYLCASGLPVSNYTHAVDMLNAAFEIRNFMAQRKKEKEAKGEIPFEIRIGIHTGPVVAGIVGVKKYAYDIWGDTVNIAARMEQNSEAGKINISGSTYELVKTKFTCEQRGKIEAKNKGMIDMYFAENS